MFKSLSETLRIFQTESFRLFWNLLKFTKSFRIHKTFCNPFEIFILVKLFFIDPKLYPICILKENSKDKDV